MDSWYQRYTTIQCAGDWGWGLIGRRLEERHCMDLSLSFSLSVSLSLSSMRGTPISASSREGEWVRLRYCERVNKREEGRERERERGREKCTDTRRRPYTGEARKRTNYPGVNCTSAADHNTTATSWCGGATQSTSKRRRPDTRYSDGIRSEHWPFEE